MSNAGNRSSNQYQNHEPEYPKTPQKGNQKATAVVLSVVTCLFMCALGYEIIQLNHSKANPQTSQKQEADLSKRLAYNEPIHHHLNEDDDYMSYELKVLREQNRRQASKIKSLKQEIVNRLQEQHDLKSTLFKQEGDPRDRARIAELSHQLTQKEMVTMQLQQQLKELEAEKQNFDRKMMHAEVTKEALTNMLEQQRSIRDQEIAKLKAQLSEYQNRKDHENKQITVQLLQYEDTQQRLKESLEEHSYASFFLDSEINNLKVELDNSYAERKDMEGTLLEQLYNTVASLELSELETSNLKKRLNNAYLRHNKSLKENNDKIAKLEKEIVEHRRHIKEKNALFDSVHDMYNIALIQTKTEIDDVSQQYDSEKSKSQSLEQELARQLETQKSLQNSYRTLKKDHKVATEVEKKLQESNEKMTLLQAELDIHKFSLAERELHLDQLQKGKVELENRYQEKIHELANTLQSEKQQKSSMELQIEYLAGKLELENARHQTTKSALTNLEQTLQELEAQLQHTTLVESELENSNRKAAALETELVHQQDLLEKKERQIGANLQKEQETIAGLERELEKHKSAISDKHRQLDSIAQEKRDLEHDLHNHITSLTSELEQEREYIASLEKELHSTTEQLEKERTAHESTKVALVDHNQTQQSLSEQHRHGVKLEKSLQESERVASQLQTELEFHQALLYNKEQQLEATSQKEQQIVALLQQELDRHKSDIAEKHQQLNQLGDVKTELEGQLNERVSSLTSQLKQQQENQKSIIAAKEREIQQEREQVLALQDQLRNATDQLLAERSAHEGTRLGLVELNGTQQTLSEQHRYSIALEKSLAESKQKAEQLSSEISRLQAAVDSKNNEIDAQAQKETTHLLALQKEQDEVQSVLASRQQVIQQLNASREESNNLRQNTQELEAKLQNQLQDTRDLEARLHNQLQHTENVRAELAQVKLKSTQLQEEIQLQQTLAESYEQRIRDLQTQENSEITHLKSTVDHYADLLEGKEQSLQQLKENQERIHHDLLSEIAQLASNVEKEAEESKSLRAEIDAIEHRYAVEQERSQSLQSALQNAEQSVLSLESELKIFHNEREENSHRIADLEGQLNELLKSSRARETAEAKRFEKFNHR